MRRFISLNAPSLEYPSLKETETILHEKLNQYQESKLSETPSQRHSLYLIYVWIESKMCLSHLTKNKFW